MNMLLMSAIALLAQADPSREGRVTVVPDSAFDWNMPGSLSVGQSRVAPRDPSNAPPTRARTGLSIGFCRSSDGVIDLTKVMILENSWFDVEGPNGTLRYIVEGEKLLIERVGDPAYGVVIHEIAYRLAATEDFAADLDIQLRLAAMNGRLMVYWRETYQHRLYRQGLYEIAGEDIELFCEGEGGSWQSH